MPATILGLPPSHLPLLLHLLIETPAPLSFLLRPESQLPLLSSSTSSSPTTTSSTPSASKTTNTRKITPKEATEARLILSNFAGLLLSVNLVIAYLLFGLKGMPEEIKGEVVRGVTGCLSVYHLFPLWRAWRRMGLARKGGGGKEKMDETEKTLGGPAVHFFVHALVGGLMSAVGLGCL